MVKPHSPIVQCRTKPSQSTQKSQTNSKIFLPEQGRKVEFAAAGPSSRRIKNGDDSRASSKQCPRRVTFAKTVMVKETLHVNNMSEKVRNQYWMTEDEQNAIKIHCRISVQKMTNNDPDIDNDNSEYCSRGLECRTREGVMERNKRKQAARRAVLLQVQLQLDEGIYDPQFIAAVSINKTKASAELAHRLALRDAEEAMTYLHHELRPSGSPYLFQWDQI